MSINRNYFKYLMGQGEISEKEKTKNWRRKEVRAHLQVACWSCGKPLRRDNVPHLCVECSVEQQEDA